MERSIYVLHLHIRSYNVKSHNLGAPDTVSGPLIVPLNYLVILHLIHLRSDIKSSSKFAIFKRLKIDPETSPSLVFSPIFTCCYEFFLNNKTIQIGIDIHNPTCFIVSWMGVDYELFCATLCTRSDLLVIHSLGYMTRVTRK